MLPTEQVETDLFMGKFGGLEEQEASPGVGRSGQLATYFGEEYLLGWDFLSQNRRRAMVIIGL